MAKNEHNTEQLRLSPSMDELMIKTVGLIEMLTERMGTLEGIVRELEKGFSKHEGEQEQGVKRTMDRIELTEAELKSVKENLEALQNGINAINEAVEPLVKDLKGREETGKTIREYAKEAFIAFIRYAMLPMTIAVLIMFGMNPKYIPWYKTPTVKEGTDHGANKATEDKAHNNSNR